MGGVKKKTKGRDMREHTEFRCLCKPACTSIGMGVYVCKDQCEIRDLFYLDLCHSCSAGLLLEEDTKASCLSGENENCF